MESFEAKTHVFIVRVWLERRELETDSAVWRGVIKHVAMGRECKSEHRYIRDLDELTAFIALYLERMGVQLDVS